MATLKELRRPRRDIHLARYERHTMYGMTIADIAKQDGVKESIVQASVDQIATYRKVSTMSELEAVQISALLQLHEDEQQTLQQMLNAVKTVEVEEGGRTKKVRVPDFEVRARALEIMNDKIEMLRPKGKGALIQVGVGINSGGAQGQQNDGAQGRSRVDFESIVRNLHERRAAAQLPASTDGNGLQVEVIPPDGTAKG